MEGILRWEDCWEKILSLPLQSLEVDQLYETAELLVRSTWLCVGKTGFCAIKSAIEDGLLFVAEQLADDPADHEWQRIYAALSGAWAGLGALAKGRASLQRAWAE